MELLFILEKFFDTSIGGILAPGLKEKASLVQTGTTIALIFPDKTKLETIIKGIQLKDEQNILLEKGLLVPIGTEVWVR